jgi:hypothetical protein
LELFATRPISIWFCQPQNEFFVVAYDIDTNPNAILEVSVHGFGGPRLNADQWGCLPKEAQEKWDQLNQSSKAIILEHKLRPPPGSALRGTPWRNFGRPSGPLEVVSPPGIVQLILQSTYMRSVWQNTLLTTIKCPLVKRLMTVN